MHDPDLNIKDASGYNGIEFITCKASDWSEQDTFLVTEGHWGGILFIILIIYYENFKEWSDI